MRFGAMNFPIRPTLEEIDLIADMGADYLELTMDAPMAHFTQLREQKTAILEALERRGLELVCHLPTFVNPADLTPRIRQAALAEIQDSLETAADLGAEKCVLHPGYIRGLGPLVRDMAMELALSALPPIAEQAEQLDMPICLENMPPMCNAFIEADELAAAFSRCPGFRMTLDVGHANIDDKEQMRNTELITRFAARIDHIHLSDNKGKEDDHIPIGTGTLPYPRLIADLKRIGFNGTATLEIFSEDRWNWRRSRNRFLEMWG